MIIEIVTGHKFGMGSELWGAVMTASPKEFASAAAAITAFKESVPDDMKFNYQGVAIDGWKVDECVEEFVNSYFEK